MKGDNCLYTDNNNNCQLPQTEDVTYIGIHLDKRMAHMAEIYNY